MAMKAVVSYGESKQKNSSGKSKLSALRLVNYPEDKMKERLREALIKNLGDSFLIPEVIEGLVEFLSDLIPHDPRKAKQLGI